MDKAKSEPGSGTSLTAAWSDPRDLEPVFVDELQASDAGDRVYLTFGQVRLPNMFPEVAAGAEAEIRPVVRLVLTKGAFSKMLEALKNMGANSRKE